MDNLDSQSGIIGTVEQFRRMKQRLSEDKSEANAFAVLQHLISMHTDDVCSDVLPELKELIVCIFDVIGVENLIRKFQAELAEVIGTFPAKVVDIIAEYFVLHIDEATVLSSAGTGLLTAFARRIVSVDCAESIAKLLWRYLPSMDVRKELLDVLDTGSVEQRFRVYEVTAQVMKEGSDSFLVEAEEFIKRLVDELYRNDLLCQINAVELLADMTTRKEAATMLLSQGVVDRIYYLFSQSTEEPDAGFLHTAFLKFFGHLAIVDITCLKRYPKFPESLFDHVLHFDRLDPSTRLITFDTLAAVGSTEEGRIFLDRHPESYNMKEALNAFATAVFTGPLELRVRHFEALSMLFRRRRESQDKLASQVAENWFTFLGEPFPTLLLSCIRKPIHELRCAALKLLLDLLKYCWAVRKFYETKGFMECVLDRRLETTADGKQYKFDIVCSLIVHGASVILPEDMIKLKLYRREGVFYVDRAPEVAMENE